MGKIIKDSKYWFFKNQLTIIHNNRSKKSVKLAIKELTKKGWRKKLIKEVYKNTYGKSLEI